MFVEFLPLFHAMDVVVEVLADLSSLGHSLSVQLFSLLLMVELFVTNGALSHHIFLDRNNLIAQLVSLIYLL